MRARNTDVDLASDPATWDEQTIEGVLDRGGMSDWRHLLAAVRRDPGGPLAQRVHHVAVRCDVSGTGNLWLLWLDRVGGIPAARPLPRRVRDGHWP